MVMVVTVGERWEKVDEVRGGEEISGSEFVSWGNFIGFCAL